MSSRLWLRSWVLPRALAVALQADLPIHVPPIFAIHAERTAIALEARPKGEKGAEPSEVQLKPGLYPAEMMLGNTL